jgi:hypothetical protein
MSVVVIIVVVVRVREHAHVVASFREFTGEMRDV